MSELSRFDQRYGPKFGASLFLGVAPRAFYDLRASREESPRPWLDSRVANVSDNTLSEVVMGPTWC